MIKRRKHLHAITLLEVVVTILVCGGLLTVLFPTLASSRENARENLCRKNLRRMFLGASMSGPATMKRPLMMAMGRRDQFPNDTWSLALMHALGEEATRGGPRPNTLTCPSRPLDLQLPADQQINHYAATAVVDAHTATMWIFRDRGLDLPPDAQVYWADAVPELVSDFIVPSPTMVGPHTGGKFLYTHHDGSVRSVMPPTSAD